jgi:predicted DsbA family dithiol-disulfide isomerase
MMKAIIFLFGVILLAAPASSRAQHQVPEETKVPLDLYVMSQCPWGVKAENVIIPAVKSLGPLVAFHLHFIAKEQPSPDGDPAKVTFTALHGAPEVQENIRQLCAKRHFPETYLDYIVERNANVQDPNWQQAASKAGLDPQVLEQCAAGAEGTQLLSEDLKAHQARQATSSPTIDINGAPYTGPRGLRSITLAICDALKARGVAAPEACAKAEAMPPDAVPTAAGCGGGAAQPSGVAQGGCGGAPAAGGCGAGAVMPTSGVPVRGMMVDSSPLAFDIRVVVDGACPACQPVFLESLKAFYPAARITTLQADSREGKQLIEQVKATALPLYVLDGAVDQAGNFPRLKSFLEKTGEVYVVRPEVAMPTVLLGRERRPHHLDLFVTPLAPLTAQAEWELMQFFRDTTVGDLTFSIHYIVQEAAQPASAPTAGNSGGSIRAAGVKEMGTSSPGPVISLAGPVELAESRRQACLFQHASMGDFFKYLACRSQDLQNPAVAESCLVVPDEVKRCVEGPEGEELLRQDARTARSLGITAGPMVLWENRYGPFNVYELSSLKSLVEPEGRR